MNSNMKVVQICSESNAEGSMFIEESFFWTNRPNKTFENWKSKPITKYPKYLYSWGFYRYHFPIHTSNMKVLGSSSLDFAIPSLNWTTQFNSASAGQLEARRGIKITYPSTHPAVQQQNFKTHVSAITSHPQLTTLVKT